MALKIEPAELEDLVIEYGLIAADDEAVCELIRQQDAVAENDPEEAVDIQGALNANIYRFLDKKQLSPSLVRQLKMAHLLIGRFHRGELRQIGSAEARDFIRQKFKNNSPFWGTE